MTEDKRGFQPVLVVIAIGFALFLSATWTARSDAAHVSTTVVYLTRFVTFATYMLIAYLFRNHLPSVEHLLTIALSFLVMHIALLFVTPLLPDSVISQMLDYISGIFEGVANAGITLLYAHVFSSYRPNKSCISIAIAYLANDVFILFLDMLSSDALRLARAAFVLVGSGILAFFVLRLLKENSGLADRPLQYGMTKAGGEVEHPLRFLSVNTDWLLLLIVAFLFPTLFGVVAQVSSVTGGNFALYDVSTEVAMIALQVLLLVFVIFRGDRFGFTSILMFVIPLLATGLALYPAQWPSDFMTSGFLIRGSYVTLAVLLWIFMARKSFDDPRRTYLYFSIYCGVSNAQLGRLVGSILMGDAGPTQALVQNVSLGALWAICIFGLVMFLLMRRSSAHADEVPTETLVTDAPVAHIALEKSINDEFSVKLDTFAARIQLAPREREVLIEAMHGYSRANIAKKLYLSPETVKTYLNRIYAKSGVTSKQELINLVEKEAV